jgi:hypothetical protein
MMKTIEAKVLLAVIDGEEDEAARLLATLLPGERAALARAAGRLTVLCEAD